MSTEVKRPTERDIEYEENNTALNSLSGEEGIKCRNYELCGTTLPDWWFDCKGTYLCTNCDMTFGTWKGPKVERRGHGTLSFEDSISCLSCSKVERVVHLPICIDCARKTYFNLDSEEDNSDRVTDLRRALELKVFEMEKQKLEFKCSLYEQKLEILRLTKELGIAELKLKLAAAQA